MKALSIRQPWAHAILHLGKRVENRDWAGCAYRGPVLLHASKTCHAGEFHDSVQTIIDVIKAKPGEEGGIVSSFAQIEYPKRGMFAAEPRWRPSPEIYFGGIVGRARIVDAFPAHEHTPRGHDAHLLPTSDPASCGCSSPWYSGGFALVLGDVEPLPFIPYKGSLGFFDVPDELMLEAIEEQGLPRRETVVAKAEHLLSNPAMLGSPRC